jgi:inhibitor of KinA
MPFERAGGKTMRITPLGDRALVVELGQRVDEATHYRVQAAFKLLESPPLTGVTEIIPAFTTLTLLYDPLVLEASGEPAEDLVNKLVHSVRSRLHGLPARVKATPGPIVEIPVCYGGKFGPDLEEVAEHAGLTQEEVILRHGGAIHLVYQIGFSPGFPYLGGLPESLSMPRRATPRTSVPPGSVGIVNCQSCIYPMATPGGWNLIGRTPRKLFRPEANPPSLLQASDRVKFRAITPDEFAGWKEAQ